jgi:dihydrofolate synthase/folylpolyglutamate synthase
MSTSPFERLMRHLALLTDYEREARVAYDRGAFDLARMERLCERLGRPERAYPVAHVTGTKGKGSTSTMIASGLAAAGLRVGLYTSPHLVRLGERIVVAGREASEADLGAAFEEIEPAIEAMRAEGERFTFFEVTTALAFARFRAERVDAAVIEVGLGGRLDSTNVVQPVVTAITSVGLDHTDKLGTTLGAIAREKAGIAKAGVPLVCGRRAAGARAGGARGRARGRGRAGGAGRRGAAGPRGGGRRGQRGRDAGDAPDAGAAHRRRAARARRTAHGGERRGRGERAPRHVPGAR